MTGIPFMFPAGGAATAAHSWDWTTGRPPALLPRPRTNRCTPLPNRTVRILGRLAGSPE